MILGGAARRCGNCLPENQHRRKLPTAYFSPSGGTTPVRLLAGVVPLLMLPVADTLMRFWRTRWLVALSIVLASVSLQNGLTYNKHFGKVTSALRGPSVSGWKTTLAFPHIESVNFAKDPLALAWLAVCLAWLVGAPS